MDRRTFLGAGAALAAGAGTTAAQAQDASKPMRMPKGFSMDRASGPSVFTDGELAENHIAKSFGRITDLAQPLAITYDTAGGPKAFTDLTGKIRLLALWAEWCPPCLNELPELATLQTRYGGDRFEILAILTASRAQMDYATARQVMDDVGAQALPLWAEPNGGQATMAALAVANLPPMGVGTSIPCAVLVDAKGVVRGHHVGLELAPRIRRHDDTPAPANASSKVVVLDTVSARPGPPDGFNNPSIWTTPDADSFIKALLAGALG